MRNSRPRRTPSPSQPATAAKAAPVLITLRKNGNGRRWRLGAGFLVQSMLVALVLLLPLLFTEQLVPAPPDRPIFLLPPQGGQPSGTPHVQGAGNSPTSPHAPRPQDLTIPIRIPAHLVPDGEGPELHAGNGPGDSWPGIPQGPGVGMPLNPGPGFNLPPQATPPQQPVHVGGRVRPPRLLHRVEPDYPALARQAHIEGTVVLEALLGRDGRVQQITVKSGHPTLIPAATNAVAQWVYEPTYLNDQPVPVILQVTVNFHLNR